MPTTRSPMSPFLSHFLQSSLSIAYVGGVEKSHKDMYGVRYYALQIAWAGFVEKEKVKKTKQNTLFSLMHCIQGAGKKSRNFQCYHASK